MKHVTLTALAFMASTLPGMAGSIYFGKLEEEHIAALGIIMVFGLPVFIVSLFSFLGFALKRFSGISLPAAKASEASRYLACLFL